MSPSLYHSGIASNLSALLPLLFQATNFPDLVALCVKKMRASDVRTSSSEVSKHFLSGADVEVSATDSEFGRLVVSHVAQFSSTVVSSNPNLAVHLLMEICLVDETFSLPTCAALRSLAGSELEKFLLRTLSLGLNTPASTSWYLHIAQLWSAIILLPHTTQSVDSLIPLLLQFLVQWNDSAHTISGVSDSSLDSIAIFRSDVLTSMRAEVVRALLITMDKAQLSHRLMQPVVWTQLLLPLLNDCSCAPVVVDDIIAPKSVLAVLDSATVHPANIRTLLEYFRLAYVIIYF
jgi:hypothetical protein